MNPGASARQVVVVGAGPAGLMAAEVLAGAGVQVTVLDQMASPARKLLLAGRGGLNLTHSEPLERLLGRYGSGAGVVADAVRSFDPDALRTWCEQLGEPTFVGSSGRVFPRSFRATPLLRAWLARLDELGVRFLMRHRWLGFAPAGPTAGVLVAGVDGVSAELPADAVVLAMGGASWPRSGSDGAWVGPMADRQVSVRPLRPANCGLLVDWSEHLTTRFAGTPIKNVAVSVVGHGEVLDPWRGDLVLTRVGLEGGPVYGCGPAVRAALDADGVAILRIDLRPDLDVDQLERRLARRRPGQTRSDWLRRAAGLSPVAVALLYEQHGSALPNAPGAMAAAITCLEVTVTGTAGIERAISTAGGVQLDEIDEHFMLRRHPGVFVAGEMLDWDAPTGGYLLQACLSTGVAAGHGVLAWLDREG